MTENPCNYVVSTLIVSVFLYKQYYPVVIIIGSVSIIIGLIAMYVGKLEGLSVKKVNTDDKDKKEG